MDNIDTIKTKMKTAAMRYDERESRKRCYNRFALVQYFTRVDDCAADMRAGAEPRAAILAGFSGRLQDAMLRAIGETIATDTEAAQDNSLWSYQPVKLEARE